jgi:hypothetical protein
VPDEGVVDHPLQAADQVLQHGRPGDLPYRARNRSLDDRAIEAAGWAGDGHEGGSMPFLGPHIQTARDERTPATREPSSVSDVYSLPMSPPNRLSLIPDRDLQARYWAARDELKRLRAGAAPSGRPRSGEELAGAFQRIRELDALCELLWRESKRRAQTGSIDEAL